MKQYDQYKPAGVEWLNHIPEHWEKKKVKYLLEIFGRIGFRGYTIEDIVEEGSGALSLSPSNIKGNKIVLDQRTYISWDKYHESPEIQIFKDDIVFVKTGSTIGKIAIIPALDEKLTLNPQMAVFKNVRINKKFLYYFFLTPIVKAELDINMIGGAAQTISQEKLNSIEVFVPSYPEQTAIAAYLDDKTAKIDTLIRNKQKLIELLKEEKAALINEAVTKGINPYVPLKPSGIDWLGDIPEHWEVKKLKYLSPYVTVGIVVNPSSYYQDNGIPTLRSLNIKENSISKQDLVYISEDANELNTKSKIFKGDLVAVRTGKPGTTAVVDEAFDGCNCIDLIIIRRSEFFLSKYLSYFLNSNIAKGQYEIGSTGAIQAHFNIETASNLIVPIPNLVEQKIILAYIETETAKIDYTISRIAKEIELMQEYRTALISEVVTGQVKVM